MELPTYEVSGSACCVVWMRLEKSNFARLYGDPSLYIPSQSMDTYLLLDTGCLDFLYQQEGNSTLFLFGLLRGS